MPCFCAVSECVPARVGELSFSRLFIDALAVVSTVKVPSGHRQTSRRMQCLALSFLSVTKSESRTECSRGRSRVGVARSRKEIKSLMSGAPRWARTGDDGKDGDIGSMGTILATGADRATHACDGALMAHPFCCEPLVDAVGPDHDAHLHAARPVS